MGLKRISTREDLHQYLYYAIQLEHATIPPYLTGLYSIKPGTNSDAYQAIRVVSVEEMLHLTLSANILNAVGGEPDLTQPDFIPQFPTVLPDGETDFEVNLVRFSEECVDGFMTIERADPAESDEVKVINRNRTQNGLLPAVSGDEDAEQHFYSIGDFYAEIGRGLEFLDEEMKKSGETLFSGDPTRQITSDYYYSGGGELIPVYDMDSAQAAIRLISEQGEGHAGGIFDYEGELSHFHRFQQLKLGRYYQKGDQAGQPTGPPLNVDWDAAYPIKSNARLSDYPEGSELHAAALEFNAYYYNFLVELTQSFRGQPELLIDAVGRMFRIKELALQLMRNPIPGTDGLNAAPTFEMPVPTEAK